MNSILSNICQEALGRKEGKKKLVVIVSRKKERVFPAYMEK